MTGSNEAHGHFETFVCISCRRDLNYTLKEKGDGALRCDVCHVEYPIIDGIPRFVTNSDYCESFSFQWNAHKRCQLDGFNGLNLSKDRFFKTTGWTTDLVGENVLEAGSGAGRFTEVLVKTNANVCSFDLSLAVQANAENNKDAKNLTLFQGDIYHLPLREGTFDKIICLGMLQHTPNPKEAFLLLIPYLKDGGEIVIDIYKKTFFSMMQWKYLLRLFLKDMDKQLLYEYSTKAVEMIGPCAAKLQVIFGPFCRRLLPIADYSHLDVSPDLNKELSILDTFDMYASKFDKPQTKRTVRQWFDECGLSDIRVQYGPNGIIGSGRKIY